MLKTLTLAAATVAATASVATANNAFPVGETFEQTDTLDLRTVTANAPGVVQIYDYNAGERGALLGSEEVRAGVNTDVKIDLGLGANNDILAVLLVDGEEVLMKDYDIR